MQVPLNFTPRDYQSEALAALDSGVTISIWCWARRGGKDFTAFAYAIKKMVETPMNVVIVWPTKKQGYDNFWESTDNDGLKPIDKVPKSLVAHYTSSESNMKIILKNGSVLTLMGASDANAIKSLRGANAKLYIFSEFVDIDSNAYDVVRPIVANNGGQIIVQSTPKIDGISGATFHRMWKRARTIWKHGEKKTQFASVVRADHFLNAESLAELEAECIEKNGNNFMYMQEYMCDWGQVSTTSYYGEALMYLKKHDQIRELSYNDKHPVYTAWDLGTADSTAITFFQYINKCVYIIDYYETHSIGYEAIINFLKTKRYIYGWHFIPWDGNTREQSDATQRVEKLMQYGLTNVSVLTREGKEDGIRRAVEDIRKAVLSAGFTKLLREKLVKYSRKFNGITGDYEGPEHKTESHAADSVRYLFAAIAQFFDEVTGDFLFDVSAQATYESEDFMQPSVFQPTY